MNTQPAPIENQPTLPAILAGSFTPAIRQRVNEFFFSIASCFESWVARRQSPHTQRAYREDVMAFVKFMGLRWPDLATELLRVSIKDVQAFRNQLLAQNAAPKTLNRRISSLSSFYKYLAAPRPSCAFPSPYPTRHTRSLSPASPPTPAMRREPSPPPAPASSWASPPVTVCSITVIGRF
jgi:hypothetical protein